MKNRDAPEAKDGDDKEVKSVDLAVDPEASLKHLCRMASNAADGNNKQMREAFKACKSGFVDISEVRDGSGNHPMSGWIDKHLQSLEKEQELELCKEKFNQQTEETPKQE